jgi:putative N-acetyltransferase (TIGR04045 family)
MAGRPSRSSSIASRPPARSPAPGRAPGRSPVPGPGILTCRAVATGAELAAHFRIRHQVFVEEQGLFRAGPAGGDRDAHDRDPATIHVIGLAGDVICGSVRLYPLPGGGDRWQGDRLAVLPSHRHLGLGAPLVRFAVATAGRRGGREMLAYIQPANVVFFQRLGWRRDGDLVGYAGVPHQRMLVDLG